MSFRTLLHPSERGTKPQIEKVHDEERRYTPAMDLAYVCVKPQMRLYVCQTLPFPNTKCVYMCHQMRLLTQRSSLRSLTFARFARTFFFDSLNWNSCLKSVLV